MSIFLGVYKLNMVKRCRCYQLYALCCLISGYLQTSWSHFPTLQIGLLCRALHWNCKPQLTVLLNIRQDAQNWFAERGLITSTVLTCSRLIMEHVWLCLVIGTLPSFLERSSSPDGNFIRNKTITLHVQCSSHGSSPLLHFSWSKFILNAHEHRFALLVAWQYFMQIFGGMK